MPLPAPSKLSVLSLFHYVNLHFIYYKKKKKGHKAPVTYKTTACRCDGYDQGGFMRES